MVNRSFFLFAGIRGCGASKRMRGKGHRRGFGRRQATAAETKGREWCALAKRLEGLTHFFIGGGDRIGYIANGSIVLIHIGIHEVNHPYREERS